MNLQIRELTFHERAARVRPSDRFSDVMVTFRLIGLKQAMDVLDTELFKLLVPHWCGDTYHHSCDYEYNVCFRSPSLLREMPLIPFEPVEEA